MALLWSFGMLLKGGEMTGAAHADYVATRTYRMERNGGGFL